MSLLTDLLDLLDQHRIEHRADPVAIVLNDIQRRQVSMAVIIDYPRWAGAVRGIDSRPGEVTHIVGVPILRAEALDHVADVLGLHCWNDHTTTIQYDPTRLLRPQPATHEEHHP